MENRKCSGIASIRNTTGPSGHRLVCSTLSDPTVRLNMIVFSPFMLYGQIIMIPFIHKTVNPASSPRLQAQSPERGYIAGKVA